MTAGVGERAAASSRCARCNTELAPTALACPACGSLVHAERLRQLAVEADAASVAGRLADANMTWQQALELLPPTSQQYAVISQRVQGLAKQLADGGTAQRSGAATPSGPWYKRGAAGIGALLILLLSKLKFLLLGLTKASTFLSMFAFFGVYWSAYGWPLALGLVLSIYIHEMGHVSMLRRLGINASAPLFIPGVGALVMLRQHITDPSVDARIGLAGPVWGLGAGVAAYVVYLATGIGVWGAIAALTGFINLFNLIPIWQLDGSRGFHALATWQRWAAVVAIFAAFYLTHQRMLVIVGIVAALRSFQRADTRPDMQAFGTYLLLVFALAWLSVSHSL